MEGARAILDARCPFAALGLLPTADAASIRASYRSLSLAWHPDKRRAAGSSESEADAAAVFQALNAAYTACLAQQQGAPSTLQQGARGGGLWDTFCPPQPPHAGPSAAPPPRQAGIGRWGNSRPTAAPAPGAAAAPTFAAPSTWRRPAAPLRPVVAQQYQEPHQERRNDGEDSLADGPATKRSRGSGPQPQPAWQPGEAAGPTAGIAPHDSPAAPLHEPPARGSAWARRPLRVPTPAAAERVPDDHSDEEATQSSSDTNSHSSSLEQEVSPPRTQPGVSTGVGSAGRAGHPAVTSRGRTTTAAGLVQPAAAVSSHRAQPPPQQQTWLRRPLAPLFTAPPDPAPADSVEEEVDGVTSSSSHSQSDEEQADEYASGEGDAPEGGEAVLGAFLHEVERGAELKTQKAGSERLGNLRRAFGRGRRRGGGSRSSGSRSSKAAPARAATSKAVRRGGKQTKLTFVKRS